jgi:hypothetical protein
MYSCIDPVAGPGRPSQRLPSKSWWSCTASHPCWSTTGRRCGCASKQAPLMRAAAAAAAAAGAAAQLIAAVQTTAESRLHRRLQGTCVVLPSWQSSVQGPVASTVLQKQAEPAAQLTLGAPFDGTQWVTHLDLVIGCTLTIDNLCPLLVPALNRRSVVTVAAACTCMCTPVYCTPRSSLRRIAKFCTILTKYRTPSWDNYVKTHDQHSSVPCSGSGGTWESHVPCWPRLAYMGHMDRGPRGSKPGSVQTRWTPLVDAFVAPVAVSRPPSKMCPMLLQGLGVGRLCCYSCVPCHMPSYAGQCPMLLRKGNLGLTT